MRLYTAVLRAIVDQQFFIIRICRFSARRDAEGEEGTAGGGGGGGKNLE